ncbi:hypothetical protein BKA62DRAFT_759811 [Auriculariales sp. MPI-PUGE-AT-0066]|nr:hypothetical protein BKA62DRAFT_759811 [Auriculariales sp. MPI-PUGE-AT-0066]
MQLARNFAVLLIALAAASSAAVERRSPIAHSRHLAAAHDRLHRGLVDDVVSGLGAGLGVTDTESTTETPTETDPASSSSTPTPTPTPEQTETSEPATTTSTDDPVSTPDEPSTSAPVTTTTPEVTPTPTPTTTESSSSSATESGCQPLIVLGVTLSACDSSTTAPTATETTEPSTTPVVTESDSATTTDAPGTTTAAPTETGGACTPQVLAGLTISACDPESTTTSAPEISSATGTVSDAPTGTTSPPDEPTGTTSTDGPGTTSAPPAECTPEVVAGITLSACDATTTTQAPSTPTGSDEPGTTSTATSDPCDPGLLDALGLDLPSFCHTTTTTDGPSTPTDGPGGPTTSVTTTTTDDGGDGPTTSDPPVTETTSDPVTQTSEPDTTSTSESLTLSVPPIFDTATTTLSITETFTSDAPTDGPTFSIPTFLTATSSIALDPGLPTDSPTGTQTDPDAVPTSVPQEQQGDTVPAPGETQLPDNLPSYIMSNTAPQTVPDGAVLCTVMFMQTLNWAWVANDSTLALQILSYGPVMMIQSLGIARQGPRGRTVGVYPCRLGRRRHQAAAHLLMLYLPADVVSDLQHQMITPNSDFYQRQNIPITKQLVMQVDPTYPLTSSSASNGAPKGTNAGGNLGGLLGDADSDNKDEARKRAIIGVCAAIGGALLIGAIWWGWRNHQLKQEQAHRRLSQNSDTQFAAAQGAGAMYGAAGYGGAGAMQERGRRDSFFFAADSLRGFEDGRFDDSETFDHRSMAPTTGGALSSRHGHNAGGGYGGGDRHGQQPIQTGAISAPILRENTLNW